MGYLSIKRFIILGVLFCLAVLVLATVLRVEKGNRVNRKIRKLPSFSFKTLKGDPFTNDSLETGRCSIFMFFGADCFRCLTVFDELVDFTLDNPSFQVIMVSPDSLSAILGFKERFDIDQSMPIVFLQADEPDMANAFGHFSYPTLYCYSCRNELQARFIGEFQPEKLTCKEYGIP